jgi:hypothetical protein
VTSCPVGFIENTYRYAGRDPLYLSEKVGGEFISGVVVDAIMPILVGLLRLNLIGHSKSVGAIHERAKTQVSREQALTLLELANPDRQLCF